MSEFGEYMPFREQETTGTKVKNITRRIFTYTVVAGLLFAGAHALGQAAGAEGVLHTASGTIPPLKT